MIKYTLKPPLNEAVEKIAKDQQKRLNALRKAIYKIAQDKTQWLKDYEKAKKNQKKKPKLIPAGISGEKLKEYLQNIKK